MTEVNLSTSKDGDIAHFASGGSAKIHEIRFVKTNGNYIIDFGGRHYVAYSTEGFTKVHPAIFNIIRVEAARLVREGKVYAVIERSKTDDRITANVYSEEELSNLNSVFFNYTVIAIKEICSYREGDGLELLKGDEE